MADKAGKAGYCSICHSPNLKKINDRVREGWNAAQLNEFAMSLGDPPRHRQTWYGHKPHASTAIEKFVQTTQVQVADKPVQIKKTSNTEFLETVRDIGMAKAINDPSSVTIEQALKATQVLEGRKDKSSDSIKILIGIVTGHSPSIEVVEGEAREVS